MNRLSRQFIFIDDTLWTTIIRVLVAVGFLSGMLMSHNLWWGSRLIPYIPLIPNNIPVWMHDSIAIAFAVLLVVSCFITRRTIVISSLVFCALLVAMDQLRLQPWVYLYFLMLLPFSIGIRDRSALVVYYRLIVSGIYWWSGAHKINHHFLDGNYAIWVKFFFDYEFRSAADIVRVLGYGVGVTEMLIGVGLLFDRSRKVMTVAAILMHMFIITFLLIQTDAGDSVVIPWNIIMIFIDVLVFLSDNPRAAVWSFKLRILFGLSIVLIWLCPALNYSGRWDHFLSFSLYSNKVPAFYVAVDQKDISRIDERLTNYFVAVPGMSGGKLIDVYWWAKAELNVPFYPEDRVFRGLSKYFCSLGIQESSIVFLEIRRRSDDDREVVSFTCGSVDAVTKY